MEQYILSSFISETGGGNKAAVVFDDKGIPEHKMMEIAKKNGFSETAFIDFTESKNNKYCIRYFTPEEEVDICGHAALASFQILKELKYLKQGIAFHLTKAGNLKVLIEGNIILIQMQKPEIVMELDKSLIVEIVDVKAEQIVANRNGMIEVISTGLKDIILEVKGVKALREISVNRNKLIEVCREHNLIGLHIVSRETIQKGSDFCCRNFAPIVGIEEESATGTSNASFLYYNIRNDIEFEYNRMYKIEQGYFMDSPSHIYAKANIEDGSIYVGGVARIDSVEKLRL